MTTTGRWWAAGTAVVVAVGIVVHVLVFTLIRGEFLGSIRTRSSMSPSTVIHGCC
jgi:hypothetical protein